jgi:hypothetical protein
MLFSSHNDSFFRIKHNSLNDFASFCNIFGDVINGRDLPSCAMAGQNIREFLLSLDYLKWQVWGRGSSFPAAGKMQF